MCTTTYLPMYQIFPRSFAHRATSFKNCSIWHHLIRDDLKNFLGQCCPSALRRLWVTCHELHRKLECRHNLHKWRLHPRCRYPTEPCKWFRSRKTQDWAVIGWDEMIRCSIHMLKFLYYWSYFRILLLSLCTLWKCVVIFEYILKGGGSIQNAKRSQIGTRPNGSNRNAIGKQGEHGVLH